MAGIALPSIHKDRSIWVDDDVAEIIQKLHYGDPTAGWAGDERLALYRAPGRVWELWRLGEDGEMYRIARARPGSKLDGLIPFLVAHDTRRDRDPFDVAKFFAEADREEQERNDRAAEQIYSATEKLYHAVARDGFEG